MEFSWIQRHALLVLLRTESARVKDLIPPDIAANLFAYHLDGLVVAKVIEKSARGTYRLTTKGQKLAGKFSTATHAQTEEIKTVIMLYAKRGDSFLLFRWSRQPYMGKITPLYDRVPLGKSLQDGINSALDDKLGRRLPVIYKQSVLIKIMTDGEMISHMNALVYELNLGEAAIPFTGRNGEAILAPLDYPGMMNGVAEFLRHIEGASPPFESIWNY